jgi:hypothetical protein
VTKIFKPEVDTATVLMEIERARAVSLYDFAPCIRDWNIEERWYKEDYVNGNPITSYTNGYPITSSDPTKDPTTFLETYYQYIAPCIENLILAQSPQTIIVNTYIDEFFDIISKKLQGHRTDEDEVFKINQFIGSIVKKLRRYGNHQIHIVLSHGDFGNNHVIKDKYSLKVIDWEYMSHRSILFDLYNCFLEQLFFKRMVPNLVEQIYGAISELRGRLMTKSSKMADDLLPLAHIYRWLFYIERICSDMEYPGLNMYGKLLWIDAFKRFEEMTTNGIQHNTVLI